MNDVEMITITKKEYDDLLHASDVLNALRDAGVDNWDYYDDAMATLEQEPKP